MEVVPFGGWERCARFVHGGAELLVTLDVGPRLISFGPVGGPNLLRETDAFGQTGGTEYKSYGGHRLWIAPEEDPKTMQPDNDPVQVSEDDGWTCFASGPDAYHVLKEIAVRPGDAGGFQVRHRLWNRGLYALQMAAWALTVMSPGGECLFPQEPAIPHSERVLPVRPLVLWGYTDMADPRWTWGRRVVRLRQDAGGGPQKVGALVSDGIAAYTLHGHTFLKRFDYDPLAEYPDFGVNFETFTRQDMLEVESVGPLEVVAPGDFTELNETWYLLPDTVPPGGDEDAGNWLAGLASSKPHGA